MDALVSLALEDIPPVIGASPEDVAAVARVNQQLARRRDDLLSVATTEMGC